MQYEKILDQVRGKRLIFSVTTGRSGTAYLASVFGFGQDIHAVHEPAPEFADVLRTVQHQPDVARTFLIEKKFPAILEIPAKVYVETSHLTCKGFLEPMLALGVTPDLIIHRRSARDVAMSMFKMGTIPGRSDKGLRFYLSPDDPGVLEIEGWQTLDDYQLCYWYCIEIERRAQYYKQLFLGKGARVTETTLVGLKTFSGLKKCFIDLGVKVKYPTMLTHLRFLRGTRVKVNESKETKKSIADPENIGDLERDVLGKINSEQIELCDFQKQMDEQRG